MATISPQPKTIEEILNAVYSGTTLAGEATATEVLNTVFNGTDALQISGGGLPAPANDDRIFYSVGGEWVESTLAEVGLAPLAPSTAAGQILVPDGAGGWAALTGLTSDVAPTAYSILGASAYASATTNLVGGDLTVQAGSGASGSAGLANGGDLHLGGGVGYGTGADGDVILDRGNLIIGGNKLSAGNSNYYYLQWAGGKANIAGFSGVQLLLESNLDGVLGANAFDLKPATTESLTDADAEQAWLALAPRVNQSGTANYVAILANVTETAIGSGDNLLMDLRVGGSSRAKIDSAGLVNFGDRVLNGIKPLTEATEADLFTVAIAEDSGASVELTYSVVATDGTTTELHSGKVIFDAINTNGTITSDVNHLVAQESGLPLPASISDAFAVTNGTNEFTISTTMTSGLTTPTMNLYWTAINNSPGTITVL